MAKRRTILIALSATALCIGCGAVPQQNGSGPPAPSDAAAIEGAPSRGVRVPLLRQDGIADAALMEGYLHVEGPCLYVTDQGGAGPRAMPAFTVPVSWDPRENVLVAGPHRMRPGDHVAVGGSSASDPRLLTWVQAPDPSCNKTNMFVSNSIEPAAQNPALRRPDGG